MNATPTSRWNLLGGIPGIGDLRTDTAGPSTGVRLRGRAGEGLVLLLGLTLFCLAIWPALQEAGTPPGWDQSVHLRDSLVYERILRNPVQVSPDVLGEILRGSEKYPLITPSGYYPPLVPGVTAFLYLLAGRSYETAMLTQLLFLGLLVWGLWRLGNQLLGPRVGLLAALMLLTAPGIRINAREYMLDLPLTALVVLASSCLLATEGFTRRGRTLAFGLLCGAGMLTKWSFFLFLLPPLVFVFLASWREAPHTRFSRTSRVVNLGLALLAGGILMAPYYAPILPILIHKTVVHAGGAADGFAPPLSWESATYHLESLPRKLFGWPLTLAVVIGMAFFPRAKSQERRVLLFLASWALALYGFFTFAIANKQSRYLLPWLPILILMGVGGVLTLYRRGRGEGKPMAAYSALLLLALPVVGLTWGWAPERTGDWQIPTLVRHLEEDLRTRNIDRTRPKFLGVIPDMREVNGPTLGYYVSRRDLPVTVVQLVNRMKRHVAVEVGLDPFERKDFYQSFDRYDYIVTKTGESAVPPWESVVPRMHEYFEERRNQFDVLTSLEEPDGSRVTLYRRRRG